MDTGVFRWGQLRERATRAEIDRAVADGALIRLRRDWYATTAANPQVVRAVAAGGVLTCASALELHGVWVPPTDRLHIRGNDATARLQPGWCRQIGRQPPEAGAVDDLETSLRHAAKCLSEEQFVVVCDSALNRRLCTASELERLFIAPHLARLLERCDGKSESGTETMTRLRLRRPNLVIRTQVPLPFGRVDLLIGRSLIVEVDGYEYHADPAAFERDRLRDLRAKALGYNVVRLSFRQVVHQWDVVGPLLEAMIARGDHLRPLPRTPATF
ncbi:DUF559 domain-containing protein [Gordonia neofelifaecis]|uniref:DUF559 domain-containing protein n=1 Tax=Gordonia neofelifaecis NRRL B-59395 TaxID=644548 RepID=F1YIF2_9ACTN|nr:DUF559 domain-containing protein [Gordonia neofelifaecis]EGD55706.1 hypothetical protein SCNU_08333 [Gordonia neofelifaecis NRRL B-59395]